MVEGEAHPDSRGCRETDKRRSFQIKFVPDTEKMSDPFYKVSIYIFNISTRAQISPI